MERLKALIVKEFIQVMRDRITLGLIIGMPVLQLLIFGFAINTDVKHLRTAVLDQSRTQESRQLLDSFVGSMYFDIVQTASNFDELNRAVDRGDVKVGIAIPPNYAGKTNAGKTAEVQVLVDATDSMSASSAISAASMLGVLSSQKMLLTQLSRQGRDMPAQALDIKVRPWYNPDFITSWYMVPGIVGVLLTMTLVLMMGSAIVRESEQGTLEQLLVTPMHSWELLLSKVMPYVVVSYLQLMVAILVGVFVFKMPFRGSILLFLVLTFFFIAASLSLGILISTVAKNQMQALQLSLFVMLPSILLSGFVFPIEAMPRFFRFLSGVIPMTYYLRIARQIILKGSPFLYVWQDVAALALFVVVVFSASLVMFKKRYVP